MEYLDELHIYYLLGPMYAVIRFGLRQPSMTPIMPPLETLTVGPKVLYILSSTMDDGSFLPLIGYRPLYKVPNEHHPLQKCSAVC